MVTAIIVAAGMGSRMKAGYNKQFIKLKGKEILAYTIETFEKVDEVDNIVLVCAENEIEYCRNNIIDKYLFKKVKKIVLGGSIRQESVYNGLKASYDADIVVIHDGARPFVREYMIKDSIEAAKNFGAASVCVNVKDTIKTGGNNTFIQTVNRENLYSIQTPQSFKYDIILNAHEKAIETSFIGTDDTSLVDNIGRKVYMVKGDYFNIKITTKEDLYIGEGILKALREEII